MVDDDAWMLLRTYPERSFAEMDLARLREDRIEARLDAEDAGGTMPALALGRGVRLYVRERHKGRALASLDLDDEDLDQAPVAAPRRSPALVLVLLIALALVAAAVLVAQEVLRLRAVQPGEMQR